VFEKASTIGEFEAGLTSKCIEVDSVKYFHDYPMLVNGKKYYCNKRYALIVVIYKSEAFRANDSTRLQSMDTCHITAMYLQKKGKDVRVFEKVDE
jgi:hypothetical protein